MRAVIAKTEADQDRGSPKLEIGHTQVELSTVSELQTLGVRM